MSMRVLLLVVVLCGVHNTMGEMIPNGAIRQARTVSSDGLIEDEKPQPPESGSMRRAVLAPDGEMQVEGSNSDADDDEAPDEETAVEVEATKTQDADDWNPTPSPSDIVNNHFGINPNPRPSPSPSGADEPDWEYTAATDGYNGGQNIASRPSPANPTGGNSITSSNDPVYSHFNYAFGVRGSGACQGGTLVRGAAECRYALGQLNVPASRFRTIDESNLCYKDGAGNGYANGRNGAGAFPVCRSSNQQSNQQPQTQPSPPSAEPDSTEPVYVLGPQGGACTEGSPIYSTTECTQALNIMDIAIPQPSQIQSGNSKPCYKDGRGNGYKNGRNGGGARLVCKK